MTADIRAEIEYRLAVVLSRRQEIATPTTAQPPNYGHFLDVVRRRASYIVIHGAQKYRRALARERRLATPAAEYQRFLAQYELVKRDTTNAQIADALGITQDRLRAILAAARGLPARKTKPPTDLQLVIMSELVVQYPDEPRRRGPRKQIPAEATTPKTNNITGIMIDLAATLTRAIVLKDPPHPLAAPWPENADDGFQYSTTNHHARALMDLIKNGDNSALGVSMRTLQRWRESGPGVKLPPLGGCNIGTR